MKIALPFVYGSREVGVTDNAASRGIIAYGCQRFGIWLVVFGFNGPLRQYFSLYRAVFQREGLREEKRQRRVKMSKQPPSAPTASAICPCPTIIQTVGRPALEAYPGPSHHPTDHPQRFGRPFFKHKNSPLDISNIDMSKHPLNP